MRSFPLLRQVLGFVFQTSEKDTAVSPRHGKHARESSSPFRKTTAKSAGTAREAREKSIHRLGRASVQREADESRTEL